MINCEISKTLQGAGGIIHLHTDFNFPEHTFTVLYGESGAGKTSILRMLAGLMTPEAGRIQHGDQVWFDSKKKVNLTPQARRAGFVFQDQALFPNMTVRQNLEFAQRDSSRNHLITEIIQWFEIGDLQQLRPATLSGGQKQKVALARSIVNQPDILLLDEPLSALDSRSKKMLQDYIQKIHQEFKLTTIMVSHDLSEISKIADRILRLNNGKVEKVPKKENFGENIDGIKGEILSHKKIGENIQMEISLSAKDFAKLKMKLGDKDELNLMP